MKHTGVIHSLMSTFLFQADALTPDIRDHKTQLLFDSTADNTSNPSIFVTYHDAQAYPEVSSPFLSSFALS